MEYKGTHYIKCNDKGFEPTVANKITAEVEEWLKEHVGERWKNWDWSFSFGYVWVPNEHAVAFKLKFGLYV